MMDTLEYIDAYFSQSLTEDDRKNFEKKCEEDEFFAAEVAFYLTTRQSLHEELLDQKKSTWQTKPEDETLRLISSTQKAPKLQTTQKADEDLPFIPSLKKSFAKRWVSYAAAACLVLALSVYLFETNTSLKKYSTNYANNTYGYLSHSMDASHDSLETGMEAYNNKDFKKALLYFKGVEASDSKSSDAKTYAGLAYLQSGDYDNAINEFDALAKMKGLFSNPGDFLKAISLLQRNKPGDKEEAKKILQKVVTEKEEGNEKAAEWLKRF